jgi:hypothetical protein
LNQVVEGQATDRNAKDVKATKGESRKGSDSSKYGVFADVICYNCVVPRHHKANCKNPIVCFIYKKEDHIVENCPVRSQDHICAKYIGSAANGLRFYQIEVRAGGGSSSTDFTNYDKVYVET